MRARFSIVGNVVSEIKFDRGRCCADFTIQVLGGRDKFHVTSVDEETYHALRTVGKNKTLLGIVGHFVAIKSHVALKPQSIFILDNPGEIANFNFVSGKWLESHLLAGVGLAQAGPISG